MRDPVQLPDKVLRFRATERHLHWAIAVPFLTCFVTALILVVVYNPDPLRAHRAALSWVHRGSGLLLILMPFLAVMGSGRDWRVHIHNIRQAWIWVFSDVRWIFIMGLSLVTSRVRLPEQGKFNAAQKLNFMMAMSTYPLFTLTGVAMWLTGATLLVWLVHFFVALVATPFVVGHIFMATVPRDTRAALQGMVSGFVDRRWAKHHHARWYREQHGAVEGVVAREAKPPTAESEGSGQPRSSISSEPCAR